MNVLLLVLCVLVLLILRIRGLENGLARTPPMGWMSWQRYRCITDCKLYPDSCISEQLFRKMADLMVSEGYLSAGYNYLIIDDCWLAAERDDQGRLRPDPERFPSGIKNLSDYIHGKGLKFGMYEDYGTRTCAGYPGILGNLEKDANTFVEWDVDYLKIDGCYSDLKDMEQGYVDFGMFLKNTARPVVYSCSWPAYFEANNVHANYTLLSEICNLWRNWVDIQDSYNSMHNIIKWFGKHQDRFAPFAGAGHWNDPDMLLIGNYGLSYEQSKTQMALWAILAAPLLMSVDLNAMRPELKEILLNREIIAINQDALGIQGLLVKSKSSIDFWVKPIHPIVENSKSYAIAAYSSREDGHPFAVTVTLEEIGLNNLKGYYVNDVYELKNEARKVDIKEKLVLRVKPSGVVLLKAIPV